ncbi:extracellular solute-binding protein [Neobacillus kokaensis]|uniref:ABC transporter substrate-binding protein n=1 Tax=Neobacillus kokaensis TaxID=2759023 RepID=A0ABQ3N5U8_9BACI|nr:extracellular solute-binding protein [Neobacillus kokaensis]GHH97900.1 ABC transporter substrate-binding protein [Neobacillus kokaensis]
MKKAVLLLFMVLMLIVSGCTSNEASNKAKEGTNDFNKTGLPIVDKKITLKFVTAKTPQQQKATEELQVVKDFEKKTNVHINWDASSQGYLEKKNLMFASGDLPDAFFGSGSLSSTDLIQYGTQGMLIPLQDMINDYAPNIKNILDKYPDIKKKITAPDGNIYSIPMVHAEPANALPDVLFINKVWLDELGLEVPKTTDEFENVLKAFKAKDPNIIPYSFLYGNYGNGIYSIYGAFGEIDRSSHISVKDGKVSFTATDPGFKEATKYFNRLYSQGLIDPEALTHDISVYFSKGRGKDSPKYGAFSGFIAPNVIGPDYAKQYVPVPPLKGPTGIQQWREEDEIAMAKGAFAITSANKHPEVTMRWIDELYSEENSIQWTFGPFDYNIKKNSDGTYEYLESKDGKSFDEFRCTEAPCFSSARALLPETMEKIKPNEKDSTRLEYMEIYKPYLKKTTYPDLFFSLEDTQKLNTLTTDILEFVNKKQAQWIINGNIDKEWDDYLKKLNDMGLKEFIDIYQKNYDQFEAQ